MSPKIYICLISIFLASCWEKDSKQGSKPVTKQVIDVPDLFADTLTFPRIYVDQNENITLNGRASTIGEVDLLLQYVKRKDGIVFYSTDSAAADPPKKGQVIELIKKYQVNIKMYIDKTFSKSFY